MSLSVSGSIKKLFKSNQGMVSTAEEELMIKQIVATHSREELDVKHLLPIVEDILSHAATIEVDKHETGSSLNRLDLEMDKTPFKLIAKLSCQMSCNCKALEDGENGHATAVSLFKMLSNYPWDAKLVLTLAAFALNYGQFWLLAQLYTSNQLAKSMAILKQLPSIMEHTGPMKPPFDAISDLIKTIMDVTRCIVEFKGIQSLLSSKDRPAAFSTAKSYRPKAVYWTVRSILACAIQITNLTNYMGAHETEATTEVSYLAQKLENIHEELKMQIAICYQLIEERNARKRHGVSLRLCCLKMK